ncbi:MAG: stage II sporulation protein P [Oscillospiraceae bacterium]|nr:stage II sporulation protein P [Oscillospiraceae bacterium]
MQKSKLRSTAALRRTVLAAACCVCGAVCIRLCAGAVPLFSGQAGLLGAAFASSPHAAGRALEQWLQLRAEPSLPPAADVPVSTPAQLQEPAQGQSAPDTTLPQNTVAESPQPESPPAVLPAVSPQPDWLAVREVQYPTIGAGERYLALSAGSVRNLTALPAAEVRSVLDAGGLPFAAAADSSSPQVLIMHTHATECYAETDGWVDPANNGRSTDTALNMAAVGAELAAVLNAAGICTVQDTTLHDYPSYNGSYGRSRATVEKWLQAYPGIRVVLDVHRDAIETDGVRIKPTAVIEGRKAAQLMIICGADDGTMGMPDFRENLRFAAALQAAVEGDHPGLTRPLLFDYRNYNQQLTTGSLLLEIGGHGNTLEEAKYTARLVGASLAKLLREYAE